MPKEIRFDRQLPVEYKKSRARKRWVDVECLPSNGYERAVVRPSGACKGLVAVDLIKEGSQVARTSVDLSGRAAGSANENFSCLELLLDLEISEMDVSDLVPSQCEDLHDAQSLRDAYQQGRWPQPSSWGA